MVSPYFLRIRYVSLVLYIIVTFPNTLLSPRYPDSFAPQYYPFRLLFAALCLSNPVNLPLHATISFPLHPSYTPPHYSSYKEALDEDTESDYLIEPPEDAPLLILHTPLHPHPS